MLKDRDNNAAFKELGLVRRSKGRRNSDGEEGITSGSSSNSSSNHSIYNGTVVVDEERQGNKRKYFKNVIAVYDLRTDPGETRRLPTDADAVFYMSRWRTKQRKSAREASEHTKDTGGDAEEETGWEEVVALTAWEFRAVVVKANEAVWRSIRSTHRSDKAVGKFNELRASSLPCASTPLVGPPKGTQTGGDDPSAQQTPRPPLPFQRGAMCGLCRCDPGLRPHEVRHRGGDVGGFDSQSPSQSRGVARPRPPEPAQRGSEPRPWLADMIAAPGHWLASAVGRITTSGGEGGGGGSGRTQTGEKEDQEELMLMRHEHRPNGRASCLL